MVVRCSKQWFLDVFVDLPRLPDWKISIFLPRDEVSNDRLPYHSIPGLLFLILRTYNKKDQGCQGP